MFKNPGVLWIFNFFGVDGLWQRRLTTEDTEGTESCFSLSVSSVLSVVFQNLIPENNKKSECFYHRGERGGRRVSRLRNSAHPVVKSKGVTISVKIRQRPIFKYPVIQ